jgi:ADP-dependent NAD(P)H-hydrate dehydratase / NAD(P)H-hydrate epimerase
MTMPESFRLVSVAEMRALEAAAMAAGVSEHELQERAGLGIAEVVATMRQRPGTVEALVGKGNNGRDAVVAASDLARRGWRAHLWLTPGHSVTNNELQALVERQITYTLIAAEGETSEFSSALEAADVVLDGLLGVGARGAMRAPLSGVADALNAISARATHPLVVAVDVPSGIDADSGEVAGAAVRADVTVTLGAVKTGLLSFPAADLVGRLVIRSIGLETSTRESIPYRILSNSERPRPPRRSAGSHKYDHGRVMIIGGSARYIGAPFLAAAAAARSGAGLVILGTPDSVQRVASIQLPEATYTEQPVEPERDADEALGAVRSVLNDVNAAVIGPGLGRSEGAARFLHLFFEYRSQMPNPPPTIVDGDALTMLGDWDGWQSEVGSGLVLTPHHGEMGRLMGVRSRTVGTLPWEIAREQAADWKQVLILKGPFSAIAGPEGDTWVYPWANPALATAGTGDVLAGLTGGLLAQGMAPAEAAKLAVWAHARAAERVVRRNRWRTLLASDLLPQIPRVLNEAPGERRSRPIQRTGR